MASSKEILDYINDLAHVNEPLTIERVVLALLVTFAVSMFIFLMYRYSYKGVLYTRNYNIGLVMTALITALIILPISANILLSLGMVGALSIVRFRTAVKDPIDIVFTFWAIAVGVTVGAGFYLVAIVGSLMIGFFVFLLSKINVQGAEPYLMVVNYSDKAEEHVQKVLPKNKLRSRTVSPAGIELIVEIRIKQKDTPEMDKLLRIKGVKNASLLSYNGDYVS